MDQTEFTYTAGMDPETVERRLRESATGVLSLADGGDAYAVPLAYHYDGGDTILFRLGSDADSEKLAFLEATDRACFVVYDYTSPTDSWSVLATGRLRLVPEADRPEAAEINRRFPALRVFDEAIDDVTIELFELRVERLTGRETVEHSGG